MNVRPVFAILLLSLLPSCDWLDNDDDAITVADLVGTWTATSLDMVSAANATQHYELISHGWMMTVVITGDGRYTQTFRDPQGSTEVETGLLRVEADHLKGVPDAAAWEAWDFVFDLSGNSLTMTSVQADMEFDFNEDGLDEAARLMIILRR